MQVNVKVKDIQTIHTHGGGRLDQPMIEVTLECNKVGETEKHEIKFSEMLSNIADMNDIALIGYVQMIIESYVKTAFKGQQELDPQTGNWARTDKALGQEFVVEV